MREIEGSRRLGLDDVAAAYEQMTPEQYAAEKGITIIEDSERRNPSKSRVLPLVESRRKSNMAKDGKRIEGLTEEEAKTHIGVMGAEAEDALDDGSEEEMRATLEFIRNACHEDAEVIVDTDEETVEIVTWPDED